MKTVEEVVDAILDEQSGYLDYDGVKIADIIRADREETRRDAIKWVIDTINTEGLDADDADKIYKLYIAAVRKEAL